MASHLERNGRLISCGEAGSFLALIFKPKNVPAVENAGAITFRGSAATVTDSDDSVSVVSTHTGRVHVIVNNEHVIHKKGHHMTRHTLDRAGDGVRMVVGADHSLSVQTEDKSAPILLLTSHRRKHR